VDADVPQCAGVVGLNAGSAGETAGAGRHLAWRDDVSEDRQ